MGFFFTFSEANKFLKNLWFGRLLKAELSEEKLCLMPCLGTLSRVPFCQRKLMQIQTVLKLVQHPNGHMCLNFNSTTVSKQQHVSVSSTFLDFQKAYEGEICCLCTGTFGQKVPKLNSSLIYCSRLYGIFQLRVYSKFWFFFLFFSFLFFSFPFAIHAK